MKANVWIPINKPGNEIEEGDRSIYKNTQFNSSTTDIKFLKKTENFVILSIGSGFYEFMILNN